MKHKFLVAAFSSIMAFEASAVPISDLYNTGAGSVSGGIDSNYSLSYSGGETTSFGSHGYEGTGWPTNGPWIKNNASSQWITPSASASTSFDSVAEGNGTYTWSLVFDLTGYNAASANFNGRWATDNAGIITLNGAALNNPSSTFTQWSSFSSFGGDFNDGLNTLEFSVVNFAQNNSNPTGLRVEFLDSDVDVASVSEPASLSLLGLGIAALGFSRRKTKA